MSGNPELFDHVRTEAYRFTSARVRETGAPLDPAEIEAFLQTTAEAYVRRGGTEVTDDMRVDVLPRVARFCLDMEVTPKKFTASNTALFDAVHPQAHAWAYEFRQTYRRPVDADGLRAAVTGFVAAHRAVPGQDHADDDHLGVINRVTNHYARMGQVRKKPPTRKLGATWLARQEADFEVNTRLSWERYVAEKDGTQPARLGIDRLTHALRGLGMKRGAIRGAVERLRGRPERQAIIDALSGTSRDLVLALESSGIPQSRITVVATDALAAKLWPTTTVPATIRKHRQRLREAAVQIEAAGIGLHVAVLGAHTVVGRGRLLPDAPDAVVAEAVKKGKVRTIPAGLVASRQGDWGSPEGQAAQALARVAASHANDEDMSLVLVEAGVPEAVDAFQRTSELYRHACHRDSLAWCSFVEERYCGSLAGVISAPSGKEADAVEAVRDLVYRARRDGLGAAWNAFVSEGTTYAFRLSRAEAAPARARIARIGRAFASAPSPEAWEAAMLLHIASARPGRRARVASLPPERRRPGRDDVAAQTRTSHMLPTATTIAYPSRNADAFVPRVERDVLSPWMETEIGKAWRVNTIQPAARDLHLTYLNLSRDEAGAMKALPLTPGSGSVAEIQEGLRRVLRSWGGPVAQADAELDHALHAAIVWAGTSLKAHGGRAYVEAASVVTTIVTGLSSVARAETLRSALANLRGLLDHNLAQAAAKASAAA